jgi:hypothetical protein
VYPFFVDAGPFSYKPYKNGPHWAFYKGEKLVATTVYKKGCEGIEELIRELAPDAVIEPYVRPRKHADRVQERRTGIYDTGRKGR